jgi:SAM-dependent methyltransferase
MLLMAGFEARGLEISPWVVNYARNTFGIPVLLGPLEDQQIEPCSLDVIAMMDVLEHLPDPVTTLRHCLKLLRPDGVMILQTPRYPEFVTYDHLVEKNIPFIEHIKQPKRIGHLYLFSETSVCRLFAHLGLEHVRFEPAIFAHYDMFLLASCAPLKVNDFESVQNTLCANSNGRMVQALLDLENQRQDFRKRCEQLRHQCLQLSEQNAALTGLLREAETARAARLDRIRQLTELLEESETDRAARLDRIHQLTELLKESEADRAARLDRIHQLTELLEESETDRAARLDNIQELESKFAALQSSLEKMQATRAYRVLRRMGYWDA